MINNGVITRPANGSLTLGEVARFFGVQKRADNKYHLSDVCRAAGINIWSRIKPVRSVRNVQMRQSYFPSLTNYDANHDDFRDASFGFNLETLATINPVTCLDRAKTNNGVWEYLRPQGAVQGSPTSWFRLLDFNGYNNRALAPYSLNYYPQTSVVGNQDIRVVENSSAEIKMEDVSSASFEQLDPSSAYLYLLWRKRGESGVRLPIPKSTDTMKNIFETYSAYTFRDINMSSNGTYEFVIAACNGDDEGVDEWIYLPGTYGEVIIDDTQFTLLMSFDDDYSPSFNAYVPERTESLYVYDYLLLSNDIPGGAVANNIVVTSVLTYLDGGQHMVLHTVTDSLQNISDELQYAVTMLNISIDDTGHGQDPLSDIYLRTTYTYSEGSSAVQKTRYMDYINNRSTSSAIQPVTLRAILNARSNI